MLNKIIRNFIAKRVAGRSDDGIMINLTDPKKVDFQAAMLEDLLMRNGVDPRAITSEQQLKNIVNQIDAINRQTGNTPLPTSGIRNTESAKVFDLKGRRIKDTDNIMGGEEMPPPGSRGGKDDIAAPVMNVEDVSEDFMNFVNRTDPEAAAKLKKANDEIKAKIEAGNKRYLDKIRKQKEEGTYKRYNPPKGSKLDLEIKEEYQKAIKGESKLMKGKFEGTEEDFRNKIDEMTDDFASGGRVGFRIGSGEGKDVSGREYASDTAASRSVRTSPSRDTGGGGDNNNNNQPPQKIKLPGPVKEGIDTYNNLKYLQNLIQFNPQGILFDVGKQFLINRLFSEVDTEEPTGQFARDGGRIGYFMGSKLPKGLATLREMVKFFSKGKDKERSGSEILRLVNPKQFNKLLDDPNIYRKFDVQKGIGAPELIKNMQADVIKNRKMMVEEILGAAKNIRKADVGTMERKNEMIKEMIERGIDRETAEEMAETVTKMAEASAGKKLDTPKLTDEGILELENVLKNMETGGKKKRDLNADGGRIGLKDGMNRRTFLKLLGGLASIPIIGKIVKPLKTVKGVKSVPIIKTDTVPGKPEWFDQLVNKVIIEGDDVTKKFATGERQSIHQKTLDDGSVVRVTEDVDDGAVRVEYESEANVFGEPVQLQYKKPLASEGDPRPSAEFTTAESGPVGRRFGPDDYEIEVDEVGGTSIKDLDSDVSKLKQYATGKGPTMKEIVQNKKRKDKAKRITEDPEAQSDAVIARQGEESGEDYMYASGGIARMLGE